MLTDSTPPLIETITTGLSTRQLSWLRPAGSPTTPPPLYPPFGSWTSSNRVLTTGSLSLGDIRHKQHMFNNKQNSFQSRLSLAVPIVRDQVLGRRNINSMDYND